MATPFLRGPRVDLRALVEADADGPYPGWLNDAETCRGNSHHVRPYSPEAARRYVRDVAEAPDQLVLAVERREDARHIGNVALQRIDPLYRSAELAILIGERDAWGQGYATEAARLICDHAFDALNLRRIGCGTYGTNEAMRRLAERLGMREEGVRREAAFKDGTYVDIVEYGALRDEYLAARVAGRAQEAA